MDRQSRIVKQKWLSKQFQTSGIQLEPTAMNRLVEVIDHIENPEDLIRTLLDEIESGFDERKITLDLLERLLADVVGNEGGASTSDIIQVVDAFSTPYILYDPVRRLFRKSTEPRKIHADAKSKMHLYIDRYLLIQQRIKRNKMFRPPQWNSIGGQTTKDTAELTELKALLGLVGERRYVLGFLTKEDDSHYFIEDLSTRLPLELAGAETAHGLFTENCIVVAEGEFTASGVFRVVALGLPPAESRAESLAAMQGLDFFGGRALDTRTEERWKTDHADDRVVILSDVWLDKPDVIDKLHLIFGGFSALEQPPSLFVLMGNFQSYDATAANTHFGKLKEHFAALGRIINQYPSLRSNSKFLIIPGPGDVGPGNILPRPSIPASIASPLVDAVPNTILGSNPCRVRHGSSDLVLFRADIQHKMRGLAILPHNNNTAEDAPLFDQLCATVLQEAHLFPVPLEYQPIYWEHDHAMSIYPMPHALVLADSEAAAIHMFDNVSCINPGSLAHGSFAAWNPVSNEPELCDAEPPTAMSEDEEEEEENVQQAEEEEADADIEIVEVVEPLAADELTDGEEPVEEQSAGSKEVDAVEEDADSIDDGAVVEAVSDMEDLDQGVDEIEAQ